MATPFKVPAQEFHTQLKTALEKKEPIIGILMTKLMDAMYEYITRYT